MIREFVRAFARELAKRAAQDLLGVVLVLLSRVALEAFLDRRRRRDFAPK